MKRRKFLKILLSILGSVTLLSFVYALFRFLSALPTKTGNFKKFTIRKNEFPSGEAKNIIVNNIPAIILHRQDKGYIALSRTCTHLGCLVDYNKNKQKLICPCHAGIYDLEGNIVSGPPPKPLTVLQLKIEGDTIVIG
jgi:cytochrome b6-f complex iron-sulfur subunit